MRAGPDPTVRMGAVRAALVVLLALPVAPAPWAQSRDVPRGQLPDVEKSQASEEETQLLFALSDDVNGDGVPDRLIVAKGGRLEAVDGAKGSVLWSSELHPDLWGTVGPAPARVSIPLLADLNRDGLDDLIFAPETASNRLVALDRKTGALLWSFEGVGPLISAAGHDYLRDGDDLIVADRQWPRAEGSGRLVALDLRSGVPRWSANVGFPFKLGKRSIMKEYDRYLPRVVGQQGGGATVFMESCSASMTVAQSFCDGIGEKRLLVGAKRLYHVGDREVVAISRTDGTTLWTWRWVGSGRLQDPVLFEHDGSLILYSWVGGSMVPTDKALLARLDPATGAVRWRAELHGMRYASAMTGMASAELTIEAANVIRLYFRTKGSKDSTESLRVVDLGTGEVRAGQ